MKSRLLAAAALFVLPLAAPAVAKEAAPGAAAVTAPKIEYTQWRLKNGLTVIAIPDAATANVLVSMWYGVGGKHDPEGRSGFAHLFEHILSRKTVNMPYNMINRLTEDVGGVRNASTGDDRTNYYETVPAQYLETLLWTHAERMARPVVDNEVFERERSIVKEELRQRVLATPYGRLFSFALPENAFDAMPQRRPVIGSIEQLDAAKLDDARAFHQAYYGPDTATLIVSGNFDPAKLKGMVDRYFGDIPRRATPVSLAITTKEPPRTSPRRLDITAPNVPLPMVGASWKLPAATSPDAAALEVMDAILTEGDNSRFHAALVRTGKSSQALQFVGFGREIGRAGAFAAVSPSSTADEVLTTIYAEIERMRSEPVTAAELAEAKNELLARALSQRETPTGRGFELGEALVRTGDPAAADKRLAAIAKVTAADIQRVARKYYAPKARVELRYMQGPDNPQSWANPAPMPRFATVAPATGEPLKLRAEKDREQPPAPGAAPPVRQPLIGERTLTNGVAVVTAQTGTVPVATLTVLLPGGAISDPRDKAGIAQFAANLATKGTATQSAQAIAAKMESLGASLGATAGAEGGLLTVTAPTANLAAAGEVLADILKNANFPEEEFQRERKRALDGLKVALKDPGQLGSLALQPLVYGAAPYGTLAGGTPDSLARLTRDDLVAHRQAWWHPSVAKVIVSGGIEPSAANALAERLFGDWRSTTPAPTPVANRSGPAGAPRTVVIDMPDAGQAAVYAAVRGTGRGQADYVPLLLANAVLGVGSNGRLFEEVRTKRGLSYGAYSSLSTRAEAGLLTASAQTKNESAADVAKVFLDEFARLGREPVAAEALQKRRLFLAGATQRALETSGGFAGTVGNLLQQGLPPAEALQFAQRLSAADPAAVNAAAARYVSPDNTTLLIVGNATQFLDKLKALRGEVTVIKASDLDLSSPTLGAK
jgi:zinc protease